MATTRILLSVEQKLHSDLLEYLLSASSQIEIVCEAHLAVDILRLVDAEQPHLWIHSFEQGPELEAVLSHIYSSHPSLIAIRVSPDEPTGYLQIQINSFANLLDFAVRGTELLDCA